MKAQSERSGYDIFLSHSSRDKDLVLGCVGYLKGAGFRVYVDWIEDSDSGRDEITDKLRTAMENSTSLIYMHTQNSSNSKWTPWEIGLFDSLHGRRAIGIMPLLTESKTIPSYYGQEYLRQYTQVAWDYIHLFVG